MKQQIESAVRRLTESGLSAHFARLQRGVEKESLRVDENGRLAQTPHPRALGSALTHPMITTDYAESLLELITPVHRDARELLQRLHQIHHFVYRNIGDEKLWVNSMPCVVDGGRSVAIARYGKSNIAQMKETYRRGLGHRYGRLMQIIAGIHYNFSLPLEFWRAESPRLDAAALQQHISQNYFRLIRNFHRNAWLICYLFGASPAVCKTFLEGRAHALRALEDHSFYAPHATSLRLSDLGYANNAQAEIAVSYNSLQSFVASLKRAVQTPNAEYAKFGVKVGDVWEQLSACQLQIENEFYADIRPKRVTLSGESPSVALQQRGVEYVEIRSLDLNPFTPAGIDEECVRFMDVFLLACLFASEQTFDRDEQQTAGENKTRAVMRGREPGLKLICGGEEKLFTDLAKQILDAMQPVAAMLDRANATDAYAEAMTAQIKKIDAPETTASARILNQMLDTRNSFFEFAMDMAESHEQHFKRRELDDATMRAMQQSAAESLREQSRIEAADTLSFDEFLADYFRRRDA